VYSGWHEKTHAWSSNFVHSRGKGKSISDEEEHRSPFGDLLVQTDYTAVSVRYVRSRTVVDGVVEGAELEL